MEFLSSADLTFLWSWRVLVAIAVVSIATGYIGFLLGCGRPGTLPNGICRTVREFALNGKLYAVVEPGQERDGELVYSGEPRLCYLRSLSEPRYESELESEWNQLN